MTSSYAQLRKDAPRLIAMHSNLIQPGAAMWKKAQAERRFKKQHAVTLKLEKWQIAALCLDTACDVLEISLWKILGKRRIKHWKDCRHIAMCVAYELSGMSTIQLGEIFNRGHDMILHAQKRVNLSKELREQADRVSRAVRKELRRK